MTVSDVTVSDVTVSDATVSDAKETDEETSGGTRVGEGTSVRDGGRY